MPAALENFTTWRDAGRLAEAAGNLPRISDLFGVYAIHAPALIELTNRANSLDLAAHIQTRQLELAAAARDPGSGRNSRRSYPLTRDGVAVLQIAGPMAKSIPSLAEGTSTVAVRMQLREARRDADVRGVLLEMDTPGGAVKGNQDLCDDVAALHAAKPVLAYCEDLVASAGVSVASQAGRIVANQQSALYGAMGVYAVVYDASAYAAAHGLKVHVIRRGEFKGAGEPGTEISQAQLAEWQRIVDALAANYLQTIARGRQMPLAQIEALADGRIHTAAEALGLGLIDQIGDADAAYAALLAMIEARDPQRSAGGGSAGSTISPPPQSEDRPMPATLQELRAAFPNASSDWILAQLEAAADLQAAAIAYANELQAQLAAHQAERAAATAAATETPTAPPPTAPQAQAQPTTDAATPGQALGFDPAQFDAGPTDGAVAAGADDFEAQVAAIAGDSPTLDRRFAAIRTVARRNPQAHTAYLLRTNSGRGRKVHRQLLERHDETARWLKMQQAAAQLAGGPTK